MPTSYCHLATHIIFSTKERYRFITNEIKDDLQHYIGGIINNHHGQSIIVGGTNDHVHILCLLPKEMSIAEFVRSIKSNSSKWAHEKYRVEFAWQTGYAAFAVSKSNVESVRNYVLNQEEHHKKESFQVEFDKFMKAHGYTNNE
ncbi:MAG TPA: IS200/IS605 family transposase [Candidatus Cloacimonadota bacterium]|nr:IS200/IS605 family transposase [Candidatus Cloacimonadota bacterium]HPT72724.1 IS200/IS605 family transposase [Candidatus Cloacimonadota bacterium]